MPQPQLLRTGTQNRTIARLFGLPLPNGQSPVRAALLADAPVALWRGADAPGSAVLLDEMANAHPGSFVEPVMRGMPGLEPEADTCLGFPGVGTVGYATIPWAAVLAPAQFTIACVFMIPYAPTGASAAMFDGRLLGTNGFALMVTTGAGVLQGVIGTGAAQTALNGPAISLGVPHIAELTFDGANGRLYLDGVLVAGPTAIAYSANPSQALRIGYNVSGSKGLDGYVQVAALFSAALSQARMTAHAAALAGAIVDLNDYANTLLVDYLRSDDQNRQIGLEQLLYRSRGVYTSDDFGPRPISLPMTYFDDATHFLGQFLGLVSQVGDQNLTFDNLTVIPVRYKGISGRAPARATQPLAWDFTLELIAKSPWFSDLALTALAPVALATDAGTAFTIAYAGAVFCEPVWILQIPATNGVALNSFQLLNTMSGESLTVNFLSVAAIPAATPRTIRIDCAAMTAIDNLGNSYDIVGSFPMLYGPVGQVNNFKTIVTTAGGASTGLTLTCQHNPRWQI